MKLTKRTAAAFLCGALTVTAAGCGNTTGTALTIDGEEIRAGIYIYYQMDALNEVAALLGEEQPDLDLYAEDFDITKQTVEGVNVEEWIKNKTIDYCKTFVAVNKTFDEYALSLSKEEQSEINDYVNGIWTEENSYAQYIYGVDVIGEYYENLGIGQQSYKDITAMSYKQDAIFEYLYGEGGEKAVAAEEIDTKVATSYALIKSFQIDPDVNSPQDYLDMLNSGMSFAEVEQAYNEDDALKGIEEDMAEAEENGEEYTGTLPENLEVPLSDEESLKSVVAITDQYPSADYVSGIFAMANGESKIITSSNTSTSSTTGEEVTTVNYYLVTRLDITEDAETMETYRNSALHELKDEEFDGILEATASGYSVTENAAAVKKYTVENLNK